MVRLLPWIRWIAIVVAVTALALEVLLRVAAPTVFDAAWVHPNGPGLYRFANANADVEVTFNTYGHRGPEADVDRREGTARVAIIGDSTTWAQGVTNDETYPAVVQARVDAEVLNVSKPGASVFDYLDYYRRNARHFAPDVVVIGFFMGNDMFSALNPYALEAGPTLPDPGPEGWRGVLDRRRRAARALLSDFRTVPIDLYTVWFGPPETRGRWNPLKSEWLMERAAVEGVSRDDVERRLEGVPAELRERAEAFKMDPWLVSAAVLHPTSLLESQEMKAPHVLTAWEAALAVLDVLVREIAEDGSTPVLFMIPRATQVDERYHSDFRDVGFEVPAEMATSRAPQAYLEAWCEKRGVRCVDPLVAMREAHAEDPALRHWFPYDVHLNVAGNAALAEALAPAVASELKAR